ncbi:MAG TPA: alpha/beta hydrolase [Mycobacterium sp.]|nr:alpha/beta hydrolase [Mycobacterium sp.]
MARYAAAFGPHSPEATYVAHQFAEQQFDTGEVLLNYAVTGNAGKPPLLLIPGQSESWWGYEAAMSLLGKNFHVYAVDLRGQGRSTRTPGRYTFDNFGNDLVRFLDDVIGRPAVVSGLSSGGVVCAWLSAYAKPGQLIGACYEDPPLFSCEVAPAVGQGIGQGIGAVFGLWSKYLGDQWSIGDWDGLIAAAPNELAPWQAALLSARAGGEPPQSLREYDPEWGRAFLSGAATAGAPHHLMLAAVKVPVLFTHHFRMVDESTGQLLGATSDLQAKRVVELVESTGQPVTYQSHPTMGHSMHGQDPELFSRTLTEWFTTLRP